MWSPQNSATAGVGPPAMAAPPPPASEDEEGMEEPPEIRDFMQELAQAGGLDGGANPGAFPIAPNQDTQPNGSGAQFGLLTAAATGVLSLGARAVEGTADVLDRLLSHTPAGWFSKSLKLPIF